MFFGQPSSLNRLMGSKKAPGFPFSQRVALSLTIGREERNPQEGMYGDVSAEEAGDRCHEKETIRWEGEASELLRP